MADWRGTSSWEEKKKIPGEMMEEEEDRMRLGEREGGLYAGASLPEKHLFREEMREWFVPGHLIYYLEVGGEH